MRFDFGKQTFAIYRSPEDEYFATDGLCTHEKVHLADGLVIDDIIECRKHNGRFCYKTDEAVSGFSKIATAISLWPRILRVSRPAFGRVR